MSLLVHTKTETPIGEMDILASERGIILLEFDVRADLQEEIDEIANELDLMPSEGENRHTLELKRQLKEYFDGKRKSFSVPLAMRGTDFQLSVWNELKKIPYGQTRSYKEQALIHGDLNAIRAVARANATNRIAIVVPCHRVIGSDGKLTGYAGGIERKRFLLNLERQQAGPMDLFS